MPPPPTEAAGPRKPIAPARPSATILVLRDGSAGVEVFMVERHAEMEFATGALVFPGGKVDPGDRDPALRARARGTEGLDPEALVLRVAAIRETFEECGLLLACPRGETAPVDEARRRGLEEKWRAGLLADETAMPELVEAEDLELATDLLVPFAHWITPEAMPKRFDTWFFLVPAPVGQHAVHDGSESVDSVWITPQAALAEARAGRRTIIPPTRLTLAKLALRANRAEALDVAAREPVVSVMPRVERTPDGPRLRIPPEAGYDLSVLSDEPPK